MYYTIKNQFILFQYELCTMKVVRKIADSYLYSNALFGSSFGLERETLRVEQNGCLSQSKHPFVDDPNIERDFCESQIEIITPVCDSIDSLYDSLNEIDKSVRNELLKLEEYLWPFSNPPFITDESIRIAEYHGSKKDKEIYRIYLSEKYGKHQMLYCGIHFNFSYSDLYLRQCFINSDSHDFTEFKNKVYLSLAEKVSYYSWLIVYLTSASPICDSSFSKNDDHKETVFSGEASLRNGKHGYWNYFTPILDYSDVHSYTNSINNYVKRGQLHSASECYVPVRLKPKGENSLEQLEKTGINHIELRMLDLNPLARLGIFKEDLEFIYLFLVYLTCLPKEKLSEFDTELQECAIINHRNAAKFDCSDVCINGVPLVEAGIAILDDMELFYIKHSQKHNAEKINLIKHRLRYPERRYAQKVLSIFSQDYINKGIDLAKYYSNCNGLYIKEAI